MKAKMRRIAGSISVVAMTLPGLVQAQFETPSSTNLPEGSIFKIVENIMNWILALVGVLGVIGFAIAGVLYLTAAGNDSQIDKAKNAMLYSIIGVIVALVGLIALKAAKSMLGAESKF
ncbi:MAG: hypothetical protein ACOYS2_02135 [Patescibacteria group bacterium]